MEMSLHAFQDRVGDGRTRRDDPTKRFDVDIVRPAVETHLVPKSRRGERLCRFPIVDRFQIFLWIDVSGSRRIHVWDDRCDAHRATEQPKQREAGHVDLAGLDVVPTLDLLDLRIEIAVRISDALGRARASGREDDRGLIVGCRVLRTRSLMRRGAELLQRRPAPEEASSDRNVELRVRAPTSFEADASFC